MLKIFVVGCPRTGTTLVQEILGTHKDVYTCTETHFFQNMRRPGRREALDYLCLSQRNVSRAFKHIRIHNLLLKEHDPSGIRSLGSAARFFDQMMTAEAVARGKSAWVEKTPAHLFYIRTIRRYIASARFVHVMRDGRDVVASLVDAATTFPDAAAWKHVADLKAAIDQYNRCLKESSKYFDSQGHLFVQYEHILDDIEEISNRLYGLLGLSRQELCLDMMPRIHGQIVAKNEYWKDASDGKIRETRSVKYARIFDEAQRNLVSKHIRTVSPEQNAKFV